MIVAEAARLARASGCIILGIEVEHHLLPSQIGQAHAVARRIPQLEGRRGLSFLHHRRSPFPVQGSDARPPESSKQWRLRGILSHASPGSAEGLWNAW